MGTLHGGILCDVADAAMGMAFASTIVPGSHLAKSRLYVQVGAIDSLRIADDLRIRPVIGDCCIRRCANWRVCKQSIGRHELLGEHTASSSATALAALSSLRALRLTSAARDGFCRNKLPAPSLHHSDGRVAAYVPPAAKCAEGAHCSASRIRSGALHVISRNKELTIRVQNVGQRNCAGLVGPL